MDFKTQPVAGETLAAIATVNVDAVVVVLHGTELPPTLPPALFGVVERAVKDGDFATKPARALYLHGLAGVKAPRVVVASAADATPAALHKAVTAALATLKSGGARTLALAMAVPPTARHVQAIVAALADATYVYRATKPSAEPQSRLERAALLCSKADAAALDDAVRVARAVAAGSLLAREFANLPPNVCTPTFLADQAKSLAKSHGLQVKVLDRKACEALGMGAFMAVARGSDEPPKFIVAEWRGAKKKDAAPIVLVGKGITFDSGGISIKPSPAMDEMKYDMGGAAAVLGALRALAELRAPVNVVGLVVSCENLPSGRAVKPGDVVTSLSGQTIEVLNTDAEGRLLLCDALSYAERYAPAAVVDVATLTGACVVALGHHRSGLFCADDALAAELLAAGDAALDPAWRMPLDDEYGDALKSSFADMANVGPREGGAITAAKFLERYAAKLRWAHLDVAGTAWKSGAAKGATGRPVGLLTHFVLAHRR